MREHLSVLKKILFTFGGLGRHLFWILPATFLILWIELAEPYVYKIIIDRLSVGFGNTAAMLDFRDFIPFIAAWFGIVFANLALKWVYDYWAFRIFYDPNRKIVLRIAREFFKMPYHYHVSTDTSEKTKIASRGADAVFEINALMVRKVLPATVLFFGLVTVGFWVHTSMAFAMLALLPVFALVSYLVGARAHVIQKDINHLWDRYYGRLGDAFSNVLVLKTYVRAENELAVIDAKILAALERQHKINVLWSFLEAGTGVVGYLNRAIMLAFGSYFIIHGQMTIGDLLFFIVIAGRLHGPLVTLESSYRDIVRHLADFKKAETVLSSEKEFDPGTADFAGIGSEIAFESVSFSYPSTQRQVLHDVSLRIPKGSRVALVGHTGSGKSTIANLILRFYEPSSGRVLVDGTDVRAFSMDSYRRKFAAVFQDTTLFNDTLRANLEYVRDGVTFDEVREACRKAEILDFVESLPDGFDTVVGERGLKLSGGEKQRISIARAIIADPEILILDEATSALDSKTEKRVQAAFDRLMKGRTSVVIAHRLSTVIDCDLIAVVERGNIVATGRHSELYATCPEYGELVDTQRGGLFHEESEEMEGGELKS